VFLDNRSAAEPGDGLLGQCQILLQELRQGKVRFRDFEESFLALVGVDLNAAASLLPSLRPRINALSDREEARKQRLIGHFYERRSNHRLAIKWTRRALNAFEVQGQHTEVPHCLRVLFTACVHMGRYDRARHYADRALAVPLSAHERLKLHINLGALELRTQEYKRSIGHFNKAISLLKEARDSNSQASVRATVLYNLGAVYMEINKFVEAELNFESAHVLFLTSKMMNNCAYVLQASGHLSLIMGQYFHAEAKLNEARKIYSEVGDPVGAALCDVELLQLDMLLNRFERVLNRIPELVRAFEAKGRRLEIGLIYFEGTRAALKLQETAVAEEYLNRAVDFFRREENDHQLALCAMVQGLLFFRAGESGTAAEKIMAACAVFRSAGLSDLELECLAYLCEIDHRRLDQVLFQRIRRLLEKPLSLVTRIQGMRLVSDYWTARGQRKRGIRSLYQAVNILEESRASIASESLREGFFEDKTEIYECLIERLFQWRNSSVPKMVFNVMELSRSRHMTEVLSRREALPAVVNSNEPLILELHRLDRCLEQLNRKLEAISRDPETSQEEKNNLLADIADSRVQLAQVKDQLGHENRVSLFYPLGFKPEEISRMIPERHLLVLYYVGNSKLYRIEIDRKRLMTYRVPLPSSFERDFNLMLNIISNRIAGKEHIATRIAERLSAFLAPTRVKGVKHFTFILHKSLQRFPLALLKKDGQYLLEHATISQCPNLPVFYFTRTRGRKRFRNPLFFFSDRAGDPKASERDILKKRYPSAKIFDNLSNPSIPAYFGITDFVHFAGHGSFDLIKKEQSYLELGGDRMSLATFARLELSNQPFINLAACQSGWMAISSGNEPHGFVVSAFAAGASGLLASLWEIDDRVTGEWMRTFYRNIDKGQAFAYRAACLEMREAESNPYFWAGFCLLGRGD